uniref:Uncharacterized protein n=1 Tax=Kuenenia stuttgartiensis TaxID=174633 RepID=Q1Q4W0_KUEST|nr:unknown protein [Candidatus Kuenenia stuttgartiensis]
MMHLSNILQQLICAYFKSVNLCLCICLLPGRPCCIDINDAIFGKLIPYRQ